jgi:thiamine transport system substrate-binding protein
MLSTAFQDQVGEQMFVYPVIEGAQVPEAFTEYAPEPADPVVMTPEEIAAGRDDWIDQWSAIMGQ